MGALRPVKFWLFLNASTSLDRLGTIPTLCLIIPTLNFNKLFQNAPEAGMLCGMMCQQNTDNLNAPDQRAF